MFWRDFLTGVKFVFVVGVLAHILGFIIPKEKLSHNSFPFKAFEWEKGGVFYNRFHVSRWMTKLPDMSNIVPYMFRKKLDRNMSSEHILKYINETCLAELVHILLILSSPVLALVVEGNTGVAFMLIYALCNIPFIMIQRYNRPKLERLYARQIKKEESFGKGSADCESIDTVV